MGKDMINTMKERPEKKLVILLSWKWFELNCHVFSDKFRVIPQILVTKALQFVRSFFWLPNYNKSWLWWLGASQYRKNQWDLTGYLGICYRISMVVKWQKAQQWNVYRFEYLYNFDKLLAKSILGVNSELQIMWKLWGKMRERSREEWVGTTICSLDHIERVAGKTTKKFC